MGARPPSPPVAWVPQKDIRGGPTPKTVLEEALGLCLVPFSTAANLFELELGAKAREAWRWSYPETESSAPPLPGQL